jgi:hypothetical protein
LIKRTPKTSPEKLAYIKEWYNRNTERALANTRRWKAANPDKVRANKEVEYARLKYERRMRPRPVCATLLCGKIIEFGQRRFCRSCADFNKKFDKKRTAI